MYTFQSKKPEGKTPLIRHRCRWEDNIRIDLKVGWEGVGLIHLSQDRDKWQAL
jgi:hypothetical protein